ncbi:MAG TPA: homocitrate synthase [Dehalococcoidia bacterium]
MPHIHFIDVSNRDGVQTARISLSKFQKTMLNWYLARLGVHQSEIGFPYLEHEARYVRANLALAAKGAFGAMVLEGWSPAAADQAAAAMATGVRHLNVSIAVSDQHIAHKFRGRLDRTAVIREMQEAVRTAKEAGALTVGANGEDASRADLSYLIDYALAAREAGADRVRYCDTIGYDDPFRIYDRVRRLAEATRMPVELHCHNDLGMGVANSVAGAKAALDAGVDAYVNVTVNGIGERAGNADLVSTVLAFTYAEGLRGYEIGDALGLRAVWPLARYASYALGLPIPINQPGVGANAFAHESGIHADGALKDRANYELYDYEDIGRGEAAGPAETSVGRVITTGEYGGINGFRYVYERLGITFQDEAEARRVLKLVQYANAHNQLPLTDDELRFIAAYPEEVAQILTLTPGLE